MEKQKITREINYDLIEPGRFYWLSEIHELRLVPMVKSYVTLRKFVEMKMLKANVYGSGTKKRYTVKGSNLITFLAKYEAGDFHR